MAQWLAGGVTGARGPRTQRSAPLTKQKDNWARRTARQVCMGSPLLEEISRARRLTMAWAAWDSGGELASGIEGKWGEVSVVETAHTLIVLTALVLLSTAHASGQGQLNIGLSLIHI